MARFDVRFTQQGTLGLLFSPQTTGRPFTVEGIQGGLVRSLGSAGSAGAGDAAAKRVEAGCVLVAVQGASLEGLTYDQGLAAIRAAGRPLTLTFEPEGASAMTVQLDNNTGPVDAALGHALSAAAERSVMDPTDPQELAAILLLLSPAADGHSALGPRPDSLTFPGGALLFREMRRVKRVSSQAIWPLLLVICGSMMIIDP